MMMKAMISQPMAGKTDEEIVAAREKAMADLEAMGYEVVNTLFDDEWYSDKAMEERGVVQVPLLGVRRADTADAHLLPKLSRRPLGAHGAQSLPDVRGGGGFE